MLIPLRTYTNPEEAYIVRGLLESAGIAAEVQDVGSNSVFPSLDDSDNGTTLYIDDKNREAAEEILRGHGD